MMAVSGPKVPPTPGSDGKVWCYYNVVDISSPTTLTENNSGFSAMQVDGVNVPLATSYQFSTTGEHLVKFTLKDATRLQGMVWRGAGRPTKIYLPDSVTYLPDYCFYYNDNTILEVFSTPGVQSIGINYLYGSDNLVLSFPSLTTIRGTNNGLNCAEIVDLGSITTYPGQGFQGSFRRIVLPETVTEITNYFLYYCTNCTEVVIKAVNPPTLGTSPFDHIDSNFVIYVPSGSVSAYQAANRWSNYASRIQAIP